MNWMKVFRDTADNITAVKEIVGRKLELGEVKYIHEATVEGVVQKTLVKIFDIAHNKRYSIDPEVRIADEIYSINNASGHYKPDKSCLEVVELVFQKIPRKLFHKKFQGYISYEE